MDRLELLNRLVFTNSIYPNELAIGEFLSTYLKELKFNVEKVPIGENRFSVLATRGKNPKILFYGHIDTVPVVEEKKWKTNPFKLTIKGKMAYGLGAYDMKGGIVSILEVAKTGHDLKIFFAVDEENISQGAWQVVKKRKGFFRGVKLIISAEPNFGLGLNSITVGRTGRCIYEITFTGKAVHVADYKKGEDAIFLMSKFINSLYLRRSNLFKSKSTVVQVRKASSESVGMSVSGEAKVEIEALVGPEDSTISIQEVLQKLTKFKVHIKRRKTPYLEGYLFRSIPYRNKIAEIVKEVTSTKIKLVNRSSVGDDNVLATLGIPVLTWGPNGGNAHASNEYVDLRSLEQLTSMYIELLNSA